jgi:hypothetical protein
VHHHDLRAALWNHLDLLTSRKAYCFCRRSGSI